MPTKPIAGPALIHVGERSPKDKNFATDEYVFAPPGTIVAPRKKGEKPTAENAMRALSAQARKLGMEKPMAGPKAYTAYQSAKKAAAPKRTSPSAQGRSEPRADAMPPILGALVGAAIGAGVGSRQGSGSTYMPAGSTSAPATAPTAAPQQPVQQAAPNPVADALTAISQVSQANGIDNASAASLLNTAPAAPQGPATGVGFAEGTGAFNTFLSNLLGAAGLTGPDLMLAQLGIMQQLGIVDPRALGVTDPAQFRTLLAEGKGFKTLDAQKQAFNQSLFGFSQASAQRGVPTVQSS